MSASMHFVSDGISAVHQYLCAQIGALVGTEVAPDVTRSPVMRALYPAYPPFPTASKLAHAWRNEFAANRLVRECLTP
jgi:hypothetical protein